jgi:hypothetical protein
MTIELTNEEKLSIVNQHMKNHTFAKYGMELTIAELNTAANIDQPQIDSLTDQIADLESKISMLSAEAETLKA